MSPTDTMADRIRDLRKRGFSVAGIVRQTGASEEAIAKVLGEHQLLAKIERVAGKQGPVGTQVAKKEKRPPAIKFRGFSCVVQS